MTLEVMPGAVFPGDCRMEWVAWFNHHRLLEPIGNIPRAEAEANYSRQIAESAMMV